MLAEAYCLVAQHDSDWRWYSNRRAQSRELVAGGQRKGPLDGPLPAPIREGEPDEATRLIVEQEASFVWSKWRPVSRDRADLRGDGYLVAEQHPQIEGAMLRQLVRWRLTNICLREKRRECREVPLSADYEDSVDVRGNYRVVGGKRRNEFAVPGERGIERLEFTFLTETEAKVMTGVLEGLTQAEIGKKLGIPQRTVSFHRQNSLNKMKLYC